MKQFVATIVTLLCLEFQLSAQVFTLPYFDDFETGAPGWVADSSITSANTFWQLGMPNYGVTNSTHSGTNCWDINLNGPYGNSSAGNLLSPEFNFANASGLNISFWQNRSLEQGWDGYRLEFSMDSLQTWNILGTVNGVGTQNWYNDPALNSSNLPAWTGNSGGWVYSSILIPNFSGNANVRFRFVFTADASVIFDGISIDDFSIEATALNSITGTAYVDMNSNYLVDAGDVPAQNLTTAAVPVSGYYYQPTDNNGNYTFYIDSAVATTVTLTPPIYSTVTPSSHTVTLNGSGLVSTGNDFLVTFMPGVIDPQISISSTFVRPGFNHNKVLHLTNQGTTFVSGTVSLTYDSAYAFLSATEPSTVIAPNTLEFAYSGLLPGENRFIECVFLADSTLLVGSATSASAIIYPLTGDTNNINNYDTIISITVNSFDPNEKLVDPEGDIALQQVAAGMDLNYTINFQNTGTADAIHVNIYDILDNDLDISTFEITGSSHALTSWNIDANKQIHFSFANINLPDSFTNEPASHGFISYKIRPLTTLSVGTAISNTAAIFFDNNLPVITNTTNSVVVIPSGIPVVSASTPVLLFPNPNSGNFYVKAPIECSGYQIFDAIGKQVSSGIIKMSGELHQITTDHLPTGLYLVVLSGKEYHYSSTIVIE